MKSHHLRLVYKMKALNVHETKTKLSSILAQVETLGEKFTICRNGKPIADLIPHQAKSRLEPDPILSKVKVKCDLTAPLTQEDWELK
jgi:antitoxin (DNA-binding transcriptional repressor) of toxin-antitoxin stability system